MRLMIAIPTLVLALGCAVQAQPTIGMGGKTMKSCKEGTQKVCADSPPALQNECLVKNWNHISSDCQDALGRPINNDGGEDAVTHRRNSH